MSNAIRDLWPDDIKCEDVISPEEILDHQARLLEARTGGLLVGHVVRHEGKDRVVLAFEVEVARVGNRVRLLEVQHRPEFEYPAAIVSPHERLPDYLKERVYRPGLTVAVQGLSTQGEWLDNEWLASSPAEFSEKVGEVLGGAAVKGIVLSLLSRASREHPPKGAEANES